MLFRAETLTVEKDADGSAFLKLDVPGRSVNVLTRQLLLDLDGALARIEQEPALPVLFIRSGKNTGFLAGADVREFLDVHDAEAGRALSRQGQELFERLARLPCPTIAAISGACLGGGLELALACDYRLAFDRPGTQLGLPEVELGLLPGWGGTQRLPHIVGLEHALALILRGKRLSAREAYLWGLVDIVAREENELRLAFAAMRKRAITQGKRQLTRPERRSWRQWFLETTTLGKKVMLRATERVLERTVPDDMPAPQEAFAAIATGALEGPEAGFQREREAAGHLVTSSASRNLIGLFLARDTARKLPAELARADTQSLTRIGIVGTGERGAALAQLAALKGLEVVVQESTTESLGAGLHRIQQLFQTAINRGVVAQPEALKRLAAIKGAIDWKGFDSIPLVVVAREETLADTQTIFRELETRTRADCVLASGSSALTLADLSAGVSRPERVVGLHLLPPLHKTALAEIVHTPQTSAASQARAMNLALALGKTPVLVRDGVGFLLLRILASYFREAAQLVREGLAIVAIDAEMRRFGMTTGPLELLDAIGLNRLPGIGVDEMLGNGWLGQSSGKGLYLHGGKKLAPNPLAENLLRRGQPASPLANLSLAARRADARERLVLMTVNESLRANAEELVASPELLDLTVVLGAGWAPHRGGPLRYRADVGPEAIAARLRGLAQRLGPRFQPFVAEK